MAVQLEGGQGSGLRVLEHKGLCGWGFRVKVSGLRDVALVVQRVYCGGKSFCY